MEHPDAFKYLVQADKLFDMEQYKEAKQLVIKSQKISPTPAADGNTN